MIRRLFIFFIFGIIGISNASNSDGLKECQAIKNTAKKLECFDKQTQKILQEEIIKKQNEEIEKVRLEKIANEEKIIAEKLKKVEKAQKVIQVVKRLQTRVQTGVSFRDYPSLIADPKFEVEKYISESANEIPEFSKNIEKSMNYYSIANSIWSIKFNNRSGRLSEITCSPNEESYVRNQLYDAYIGKSSTLMCGEGLLISDAVSIAWSKASQAIDDASKVLQTTTTDITNGEKR